MGHIEKNMALALDVVTYIDLLILNLSTKLQINLLILDNIEHATMLYMKVTIETQLLDHYKGNNQENKHLPVIY